ncbi:MAG: helicase-related protein, partial [Sphingosinicella sp.]
FRAAGPLMILVDMVVRIAANAQGARSGGEPVNQALVTSLGLQPETVAKLMREIGFKPAEGEPAWVWHGRERRPRSRQPRPVSPHFAALAELKRG